MAHAVAAYVGDCLGSGVESGSLLGLREDDKESAAGYTADEENAAVRPDDDTSTAVAICSVLATVLRAILVICQINSMIDLAKNNVWKSGLCKSMDISM